MKRIKIFCLMATIALSTFSLGCSKAQQANSETKNKPASPGLLSNKKVLIVYLSRTNNTRAVAQMIHQQAGGKLVGLELLNPYPQNYQAQVAQVVRENEAGFLTPLKTKIDSIETYEAVFVGFPTWDMKMPPPMKSFLKQYNLSGKTIIPFNTNAGYGVGSGFQTIKELCPNSTVLEGFSIRGGIERDGVLFVMEGEKEKQAQTEVTQWLQKLNLLK